MANINGRLNRIVIGTEVKQISTEVTAAASVPSSSTSM
jgi:hypothetical protein